MSVATAVTRRAVQGTRPTEICPGRLWSLGGCISAGYPPSWMAPRSRGWLPVQCYGLRDGEHFVLIDTGLVGHGETIRAGLAELTRGTRNRHVMLTRREPDTMMNLPWIVREFGIHSIRCCGPIDPFDLVERLDEAHTSSDVKAAFGISVDFLTPNSRTTYDSMSLEIMRPGIRILATDWMYESSTRTLFCSDLWGFVTRESIEQPVILDRDGDCLSTEAIEDHLLAKFDWLCGIDTAPIAAGVSDVLARYQVDRLAPSYGCIIEGQELVERVVARTLQALERLAARPRPRPMGDFSWLPTAAGARSAT